MYAMRRTCVHDNILFAVGWTGRDNARSGDNDPSRPFRARVINNELTGSDSPLSPDRYYDRAPSAYNTLVYIDNNTYIVVNGNINNNYNYTSILRLPTAGRRPPYISILLKYVLLKRLIDVPPYRHRRDYDTIPFIFIFFFFANLYI